MPTDSRRVKTYSKARARDLSSSSLSLLAARGREIERFGEASRWRYRGDGSTLIRLPLGADDADDDAVRACVSLGFTCMFGFHFFCVRGFGRDFFLSARVMLYSVRHCCCYMLRLYQGGDRRKFLCGF